MHMTKMTIRHAPRTHHTADNGRNHEICVGHRRADAEAEPTDRLHGQRDLHLVALAAPRHPKLGRQPQVVDCRIVGRIGGCRR